MTAYDDWKQTDKLAGQMATYAAKHEALAARIRLELRITDFITEIEVDGSLDEKVCHSITQAYLNGTDCGAILHQYANDWLTRHAEALATQRLQGSQE
jgi:hypothetical protein